MLGRRSPLSAGTPASESELISTEARSAAGSDAEAKLAIRLAETCKELGQWHQVRPATHQTHESAIQGQRLGAVEQRAKIASWTPL